MATRLIRIRSLGGGGVGTVHSLKNCSYNNLSVPMELATARQVGGSVQDGARVMH